MTPERACAFLWIVWCLVWLVSAFRTKKVAKSESVLGRLTYMGPVAVAALLIFYAPRLFDGRFLAPGSPVEWLGVVLTAAGVAVSIWARAHLGGNWSGRVTLKERHELIQAGPYSLVRHPIYTGLLLAAAGSSLASGRTAIAFALPILFVSIWIKLRREEGLLASHFPEYGAYRGRVKALIPRIL